MNTGVIIIIVVAVIIGGLAILYFINFNKIKKDLIRVETSEEEINETLEKRYDLLIEIEKIINESTNLKQNNFKDFENKRKKMKNIEFDKKLTKVANTFNKIWDDYPVELEKESFRNLMTDLKINEEKNESSKSYYNKYANSLNELIHSFPTNIISKIHKIEQRECFDNKNINDEDILDFKY